MMKRSAGILPFKIEQNEIYVYLEHPGGPYWQDIDKWSICKGEYKDEKAIDAAVREFKEETNFSVNKQKVFFLGSKKQQATNKLVIVFAVNQDIDPSMMKSNYFKLEWPPLSGTIQEFPEMDKASWFNINEAKDKIFAGQLIFLNKLVDLLERQNMVK